MDCVLLTSDYSEMMIKHVIMCVRLTWSESVAIFSLIHVLSLHDLLLIQHDSDLKKSLRHCWLMMTLLIQESSFSIHLKCSFHMVIVTDCLWCSPWQSSFPRLRGSLPSRCESSHHRSLINSTIFYLTPTIGHLCASWYEFRSGLEPGCVLTGLMI